MASLALGVKFLPVSNGTADFVYSATVQGYVDPTGGSGLTNGKTYRYRAENAALTEWEYGTGVWNSGTGTLTRATVSISSTGSKVSFTAPPQVGIIQFVADVLQFDDAMSLTNAQQVQALANLGSFANSIVTVGTTTLGTSHVGKVILTTAPGQTFTLPSATTFANQTFTVFNNQTGTLTLTRSGSDVFAGFPQSSTSIPLAYGEFVSVIALSGGFWIVINGAPNVAGGVNYTSAQGLSGAQQVQGRLNVGINQTTALGASQDFNTAKTPGTFYTIDAASTNAPAAGNYWHLEVLVYAPDPTNYVLQRASSLTSGTRTTYYRTCEAGSWNAWRQVMVGDNNLSEIVSGITACNNIGAVSFVTQSLSGAQKIQAQKNIRVSAPTTQVFTTGSGTYTTPAGCTYIKVRMRGGGGGGAGSSTTTTGGGTGGAGVASTFGTALLTANGGGAGANNVPGAGGTASGGFVNLTGSNGGALVVSVTASNLLGAPGGISAGGQGPNFGGVASPPNSGAGGSGGSFSGGGVPGCGGGGAGYLEYFGGTPLATYNYAVGAGGTAGSAGAGGTAGSAGGSGSIIVEEYYN